MNDPVRVAVTGRRADRLTACCSGSLRAAMLGPRPPVELRAGVPRMGRPRGRDVDSTAVRSAACQNAPGTLGTE